MADVAQLGIAVDSSQLKQGTAELRNFEAAAKRTGDAVSQSQKGFSDASKRVAEHSTQTKAMATSTGLARHELVNLSRQLQDVGVSLASGQSPFLVAIQQGTQMADIFGSSKTGTVGGALKQVASGIANFLTPARVAGGAIAAIGVAGAMAYSSLKQSALGFDDLSRSVGATVGQLRGLQTAAGYKGIGTEDFTKGMERFGQSVYDAKNNMGGLAEVFRANNTSAKDFNGYLLKAADLIKNAKDDQTRLQLLQQMGLPATMQWVRFLSQGADGIKKATEESVKFNESAEGKLLASARKFDEAWDKATTNASNKIKSWGLSAYEWLDGVVSRAGNAAGSMTRALTGGAEPDPRRALLNGGGSTLTAKSNVDALYAGTALAGPNKPTVDPDALRRQLQLEQQRIGVLGQTATVSQQMRAVELSIQSARLSGISITKAEADNLGRLAREQALGITQIKASADAYKIENETIGMSTGAATAYAAAQTILNEKKRLGVELSTDQRAAILSEAEAMGRAAQAVETTRFQYDTFKSSFVEFGQNLRQGQNAWDSFKNAGVSALGKISDKLMSIAADGLWKSAFGGASGGGGIFSGIFGGGSPSGYADGGYTGPGPRMQIAGAVHAGEYVFSQSSVNRIGVGNLERLHRGYADGGFVKPASFVAANSNFRSAGSDSTHVTVGVSVDDEGNLRAYVKNVAQQSAQSGVKSFAGSQEFKQLAHRASREGNAKRWM